MGVTLSAILELLFNTNARMYLYNTPRDTMAKDLMFQCLCSTSIWNAPGFMPNTSNSYILCALELMLNTNISKLMCSRSGAQHKNQITHVLQSLRSTQNLIIHVLQGSHPTHYRTQLCIHSSAYSITIIISVYAF